MNVLICGSRHFNNYELLKKILNKILKDKKGIIVLSGKARGADTLGEKYAEEKNIPVKEFPAKWDKYGKAAGPIRNQEMIDIADMTIAFFGENPEKSRGTKDAVSRSKKKGIPVIEVKNGKIQEEKENFLF